MRPTSFLPGRLQLGLLVLLAAACGGAPGGCGGACAFLAPIPGGFQGKKIPYSVTTRVSQDGFTYLSTTLMSLLSQGGLPNPMQIPVSCMPVTVAGGGLLCDQNLNGQCDPGEQCLVSIEVLGASAAPADPPAPDSGIVRGSIELRINTGDIWADICAYKIGGACGCQLQCSANFQSARSGKPTDTLTADLKFSLDTQRGNILSFNLDPSAGIGALEAGDLLVQSAPGNPGCLLTCNLLSSDAIKNWVVDQFVKPQILAQFQSIVDKFRCQACGAALPACPASSTCTNNICKDASGACVPTPLGFEGRLDLSALTQALGGSASAGLDIYDVAGGAVSSKAQSHFTSGVIAGAEADTLGATPPNAPAACVPDLPPPAGATINAPDFGPAPAGYQVGIAVSTQYMDQLAWASHRLGAMCFSIGNATSSVLTLNALKALLPSLGPVSSDDQHDAPAFVVFRPLKAPTVAVGANQFDPITQKLTQPLITLRLQDAQIDVYTYVQDRLIRIFSILADVELPFGVNIEGCPSTPQTLTPAIGDLSRLVVLKASINSEILAEDPAVQLKDLVAALLTQLQPLLAGPLPGIALPAVGNFRLHVDALTGLNPIAGSSQFEHVALFAHLVPAAACATYSLDTRAVLARSFIPTAEQMRPPAGGSMPWPQAEIAVSAVDQSLAAGRPVEYGYRVDQGLWSVYRQGPALSVRHPAFLLQGWHQIWVRARAVGVEESVDSTPAKVDFLVDWEPPSVKLAPGPDAKMLQAQALDNVSPPSALQYAYRVGAQPPSEFGPARLIDRAAVEQQGGLEVLVRDQAGNVGRAQWKLASPAELPSANGVPVASTGCSSGRGPLSGLWALGMLLALWLRRSR